MGLLDIFQKPETPNKPEYTQKTLVETRKLLTQITSTKVQDLVDTWLDGYNPNEFIQQKRYCTIDDMLIDEHIFGVLDLKKYFLLSTGYHFVLPNAEEDPKAQEILDFVIDNFENKYIGLFQHDLYNVLSAWEYGFSLSEKMYERVDDKICLRRLMSVPPHSIEFYNDNMGRIVRIIQRPIGEAEVEIPHYKVMVYSKNDKWNNPYGISDLQRCYRSYKAKELIIKMWNIYLSRFAAPLPVGKVPSTASLDEYDKMKDILDTIQSAVSLVIPQDAEIDLVKAASSGGEFDAAIERYNQMIARTLLIPDLMGFGQSTKGGSFSLGQKQFDLFKDIVQFDRKVLEERINESMIKQLVDINFGKQEVYPEFQFLPYKDEMLDMWMDKFLVAIDKGMPVTVDDWSEFRRKIGFAELDEEMIEDEDDVDIEDVPPVTPVNPEPKEDVKSDDPKDDEEVVVENAKEVQEPVHDSVQFFRQPTKYEARVDFVKQDDQRRETEDKIIERSSAILEMTREELKKSISRKQIVENNDYDAVKTLQLKFLGGVKTQFNDGFEKQYKQGRKDVKQETKEIKQDFNKNINDTRLTPKEAVKIAQDKLDATTFQAVGKLNDELLNRSKQAVINGLDKGKSYNQIVKELDEIFNGVTQGAAAADVAVEPFLLETIVRTNSTDFYNLGRKQEANTNDFVWGYEYSAIIDARTTDRCMSLDGKLIKKDDPILENYTPPLHYNCRSTLRLITTVDVEEDNLTPSKLPSVDTVNNLPGGKGFVK